MSFFDDASLVMIPSGYKTSKVYSVKPTDGTGDLTFTRSNDTATRVGPDGLIEKVRTNLILQSETFNNASWTKDSATITANTTTAPDGTTTADTLTISDSQYIYQSITLTAGVSYTISLYVRVASGTNQFKFNTFGSSNTFISSTQTATTAWQRFSFTFTAVGSGSTAIYPLIVDGLAGGSFFIWGAQVETTDFGATPYIATTTAAVSVGPVANVPRLDYLNSSCPRLLLEPQRTNALTNSENFSSGYFSTDVTVTTNTTTSPDGYISADTITEGTANDLHRVGQNFSAVSGSVYTASLFCKAGSGTRNLGILFGCGFGEQEVVFNVNNGTIVSSTGATGTITNYGNGWYRCTATATSDSTTNTCVQYQLRSGTLQSYLGNGTSSLIYWGAQVEAGAYATSYIPTLGAAVTRGADAASLAALNNADMTFTAFLELEEVPLGGSAADWLNIRNAATLGRAFGYANQFGFADAYRLAAVSKTKMIWKQESGTTAKIFGDGALLGTSTSGTYSTPFTIFEIIGSSLIKPLRIKQFIFFANNISDADCIALTA